MTPRPQLSLNFRIDRCGFPLNFLAMALAMMPGAAVQAADGSAGRLSPWVTFCVIALVLVVGLYLQSTRRRTN